ncbi:PGF-CTERM sorting domain-containing protein [Methanococcoides sp.]|jgi:hypothetical protein|uniref:PGF-CTERM sorting domain-containing protein n=1 Tax=Methanococcoides sp. TaxID=1966350 RepID=UPI00272E9ECD|nr:PGF-CTERM sorting domain-containing protein [Methanococcoides sp.]
MKMDNLRKYSVFLGLLVIALSLMSAPVLAGEGITGSRDISKDTVNAGDTFSVTIVLSSTGSYAAPTINENLPAAWTVSTVQGEGAVFKESNFEWMWFGFINPGESKTLVYEVRVPSNEKEGSYNIDGEVSVSETVINENGDEEPHSILVPISGDNTINVAGSSSSESTNDPKDPSSTETSTSSIETISEGALEVSEEENDADPIIENESAEEVATDEGSSTDVQYQDSEPKTPGFELIFAVIGLLMSVYLSKRY